MKKMNWIGCLLMGAFLCLLTEHSRAASPVVSPKITFSLNYTTTVTTITVGPATLFSVMLGTGAASEFVVIWDTNTNNGGTAITQAGDIGHNMKTRLFFSSGTVANTANTFWRFDPPLFFSGGIQAADSAATGQSMFTYEEGRGNGQ